MTADKLNVMSVWQMTADKLNVTSVWHDSR